MPSPVWLPGAVADQIHQESLGFHEAARVKDFTERLRAAFGREFDCVLWTAPDHPTEGFRQGFYYIIRRNLNGTVNTWEVNDHGAFREPSDNDIEAMKRFDFHRPGARDAFKKDVQRTLDDKERRRKALDEERIGRMQEKADFLFRTQIPVTKQIA